MQINSLRSIALLVCCGIFSVAAGLGDFAQQQISAVDLEGTRVLVGAPDVTNNATCAYQDCTSYDCRKLGQANVCEHGDDYLFAADYTCDALEGATCTRDDYGPCYDEVHCNKNPLFKCTDSSYCQTHHANCTTVTIDSYDDCSG